jgi:hypothetical protein
VNEVESAAVERPTGRNSSGEVDIEPVAGFEVEASLGSTGSRPDGRDDRRRAFVGCGVGGVVPVEYTIGDSLLATMPVEFEG